MERNLISTASLSKSDLNSLLDVAQHGKACAWRSYASSLSGRSVGLLFMNPSLRTRVSLQVGIAKLGGQAIALNAGSDSWSLEYNLGAIMNADRTEHVKEAAGVLSRYFDVLCVRSFPAMQSWEEDRADPVISAFAAHSTVPFINLESGMWHPCQALGDALTLRELFGDNLRRKKFVLTWANHPKQLPMAVPHSTLLIAAQLGMDVMLACPENYTLAPEVLDSVSAYCAANGCSFSTVQSQDEGFEGAHVVYAKSWTPPLYVGRQADEEQLRKSLAHWIVTPELMRRSNNAYFMHCLPVRRNVVVSDEVLDSGHSVILQQAENRMHAQNAWLSQLFIR